MESEVSNEMSGSNQPAHFGFGILGFGLVSEFSVSEFAQRPKGFTSNVSPRTNEFTSNVSPPSAEND
jgi:hypothetical protein